jgi:hypothetical protein
MTRHFECGGGLSGNTALGVLRYPQLDEPAPPSAHPKGIPSRCPGRACSAYPEETVSKPPLRTASRPGSQRMAMNQGVRATNQSVNEFMRFTPISSVADGDGPRSGGAIARGAHRPVLGQLFLVISSRYGNSNGVFQAGLILKRELVVFAFGPGGSDSGNTSVLLSSMSTTSIK